MNRFEIERHIGRARLEGPAKAILRTLCTRMDADTGLIPERFTLSLRQLALAAGDDRATVCRCLDRLERAGWVIRNRPPVDLARRYHFRTCYEVRVPFFYPKAGRTLPDELVAEDDTASRGLPDELVADSGTAGRAARLNPYGSIPEIHPAPDIVIRDDELAELARTELAALTGRPISIVMGRETVRLVLMGRPIRDPRAYLLKAIRDNPQRFAPARSVPPPFKDLAAEQAAAIARSEQHREMEDT